ncbi:MAG: peptide chain release factor 2 [Elusimicrobia bacterium RIFCSPLOWO2_01_FULL_54_10]|nr:MAG: peptide chain release factor 2 [Elusimicrobia bacterium RIFCSPLOWO2_01_FULL_54_10]
MSQLSDLKDVVARCKTLKKEFDDIEAHWQLASEMGDESELEEIEKTHLALLKKIDAFDIESKLSGEHDKANAIVSLHAGAGGTEACDWNDMLYRMIQRWANAHGYEMEVTDILPGEEAGLKSVTFFVKGQYAYGYLKSEIGVHRLVRISPFDSNKRRHTSFASCDIIPEIEDTIVIDIKESDLKVDTYRASGAGGQHVNKTESAVRITHAPSGIIVACQIERSQIKNRATAMKMLRAKLYDREQEKKRAAIEKHYDDKGDIAWGNQIRSYVFMPYQLVKDARTGHETGNVAAVMDGDLDPFMRAFLSWKGKK